MTKELMDRITWRLLASVYGIGLLVLIFCLLAIWYASYFTSVPQNEIIKFGEVITWVFSIGNGLGIFIALSKLTGLFDKPR